MAAKPIRRVTVADRTAREHKSIAEVAVSLEWALTAPTATRLRAWRRRVRRELAPLRERIAGHCASAEALNGILSKLEVALGRSRELTLTRRLHRTMVAQADGLHDALAQASVDVDDLRELGSRLAASIRRHHAREADMVLLAFQCDIGVGD